MDDEESKPYQNIDIEGAISVERVEGIPNISDVFLLLGPIGAGKSTFIEALSGDDSLQISSDGLEGFTQSISAYRLNNVLTTDDCYPIYLVDVPGFGDTKISQVALLNMLKEWMKYKGLSNLGRILYITPIDTVRIPGSQRGVLESMRALTGVETAGNITIVSTMWDALWGRSAVMRAERSFDQLRDDVWKDFITRGSKLVRFLNTQESALSVIDKALETFTMLQFHVEDFVDSQQSLARAPFARNLVEDLRVRIVNLEMERDNTRLTMQSKSGEVGGEDGEVMKIMVERLEELERCLEGLMEEMMEFDDGVRVEDDSLVLTPIAGFVERGGMDVPRTTQEEGVQSSVTQATTSVQPT